MNKALWSYPMKLKIFTDKGFLLERDCHVVLLYPFWGLIPEPEDDKDAGRFDEYSRLGRDFFHLVSSIAEADAVLLPFEWESNSPTHAKVAFKLAEEAKSKGKKVMIFFNSDSDEDIPIENSIIFRTSFYRSKCKPNEFALPGWSVDFLKQYSDGKLRVRKKGSIPIVGYCGYVDYVHTNLVSMLLHGTRLLSFKKFKPAAYLRGRAVRTLLRDKRIKMNFIYRTRFGGYCDKDIRLEYATNMQDSDYALVARGGGNFSYRLYEVLSCGRIPVFIDTDCVLPFDEIIDWKRYCIWIDVRDTDSIADKIVQFHEKISGEEFEELQVHIRQLYEEWISPVGFHKNLWRCIK